MMILVTGATGFVGRKVVEALVERGHSVRALVHSRRRAAVLSAHDVDIVEGDILVPGSLAYACEGVDAVIHLVAVIRENKGATFQQVNYQGTSNLLRAAEQAEVGRFVLASTIGADSGPSIPYLYSRWLAEQETERSPVPHAIVRFSVAFGKGDEFFNMLAAQVKLSPVVAIAGDGAAQFQPIAVEDVAMCLVGALERDDVVGRTIEAGGPAFLSYEQIVDLVAETLGARIAKLRVPMVLMRPVAAVMQALVPRPPVTPGQLKLLGVDSTTELDSVQNNFAFTPRPARDNIRYVARIRLRDALKMNLGIMPVRIRDH